MMGDISDAMLDGDQCQFCGAAMEGGYGDPQTCSSCRHDSLKAPEPIAASARLYVLTHEIIELEDYEEVPNEGTEIEIASAKSKERIARLETGLRNIVSMYGGFTNTKEMMEEARKALGSTASGGTDK